jgi:hypothetical protein
MKLIEKQEAKPIEKLQKFLDLCFQEFNPVDAMRRLRLDENQLNELLINATESQLKAYQYIKENHRKLFAERVLSLGLSNLLTILQQGRVTTVEKTEVVTLPDGTETVRNTVERKVQTAGVPEIKLVLELFGMNPEAIDATNNVEQALQKATQNLIMGS